MMHLEQVRAWLASRCGRWSLLGFTQRRDDIHACDDLRELPDHDMDPRPSFPFVRTR
ncbi:hypothetical protein [Nonomuraea sp. KM90]|uniref:hypothetical protein n=1 Tax=Nonomuraea sp. KM90 TaxID=3457428 RepID=UPI003FCCD0AC